MAKRDYYEILGVNKSATPEELKKVFRKLAIQYHPDKNSGDKTAEAKFKEINEAYDVLKDEQKRAAYDRFGHSAFEGGGAGAGRGPGAGGFDFRASGFGDIFEDLFGEFMGGGGRSQTVNNRGNDLRYNLDISLEEAYKGLQKSITISTFAKCDECKGNGAEGDSKPDTCGVCKGFGKVRMQQGFFTIEKACHICAGTGSVIKNPCKKCHGQGRVKKQKTLAVNIPSGVEEGTRIRLSSEGEAGLKGGTPGDLYIFLTIRPHKFFEREGNNLHCKVPIKMSTAALGGSIEIPTIDGGKAKLNIPAGTQNGNKFRMKDKGMPVVRGKSTGDMFVHTVIEIPVKLTKKQKELLQEFEKEDEAGSSPASEGFFSKVKGAWDDLASN